MAVKVNNFTNTGYKVTTRILDWNQMVREADGPRWNLPQANYFIETPFGQRVFVKYSWAVTGNSAQDPN